MGIINAMARETARAGRNAAVTRNRMLREEARAAKRQEQAAARAAREYERESARATRDHERALAQSAKEEKQRYLESRTAEAEEDTQETQERILELQSILEHTLNVNDTVSFQSLKTKDRYPAFRPDSSIATTLKAPEESRYLAEVPAAGFLTRIVPFLRRRHESKIEVARIAYEVARSENDRKEVKRKKAYDDALSQYETAKAEHITKVTAQNEEIDRFEEAYRNADPESVVAYNNMVLERSEYPDEFPQEFRIAYIPESKELVIEYEIPGPSIVPDIAEFRYVKAKDTIERKPRKASEIKDIYQDVVASIALRSLHEVFEADQGEHLVVVVFNGFVQTVDAATGKDIRPHLVSVRVTKERFLDINLSRIDKRACLRNLGAQVSPRPDEVQPVKPIVDFDMVDKRFVEQSDVLSDLESRPNLMDLNPFEFENLVCNLFSQLGLETRLTRSSRDGGVDVVAFDLRPILGGKVVIQAKRWKNTVGVSAVRDLYGTMMNEGANKGILVCTSGYGPDAFDFASDKPIELMDGGKLLYMLDQVGVQARIVFPDDWRDR